MPFGASCSAKVLAESSVGRKRATSLQVGAYGADAMDGKEGGIFRCLHTRLTKHNIQVFLLSCYVLNSIEGNKSKDQEKDLLKIRIVKRCQHHIRCCARHTGQNQAVALFVCAHTGPGNAVGDRAAREKAQTGAASAVAARAGHADA